ncbi:MAG: translation elongation factor Ts [Rickettsiales bacterium]|nr:translation elongation factor Ts [Rickettsiales bacterium]
MIEIKAELVKKLRERTGAGMMDAKKALVEAGGDMEKAIDVLRTKGLAKAAKKSDREAAAGAVGLVADGCRGVVVEVNSETDFVARNGKFQAFVKEVAGVAAACNGDIGKIMDSKIDGASMQEELASHISAIGERLHIRRADEVAVSRGMVVPYIHNKLADGIGLIGVLVGIESSAPPSKIQEVGEQIAMHVAASSPQFLNIEDVDAATLSREEEIAREKAIAAGKPAEIAEKMVAGNIKKYYDEVVLNEQAFFIDPSKKIKDVVKAISPDAKIVKFVRFQVGEGAK